MKRANVAKALKTLKSQLQAQKNKRNMSRFTKEDSPQKIYCTCKDSKGESKTLYTSQKEIAYLLASKTISLYSYPCPYEKGWHLTKR